MKTIKYILLALCLAIFMLSLQNCGDDEEEQEPEPTQKEIKTGYLVNKTNGWTLRSITVPVVSATSEDDWVDFKLTVTSSNMNTSGHATGAEAVWPSGGWTMSEDTKTITRTTDDVVMTVIALTETEFSVSFSVPEGTEINGRLSSLSGDYTFVLE